MHRVSWNSLPTSPSRPLGSVFLNCLPFPPSFLCQTLAIGTFARQQQGDLEQSILSFTKAIYLPHTRDTPPSFLNIVHTFYHLALGVFIRVEESRRPEDVKCCIRYFRYVHEQWHEVSMKFPFPVSTALIHALAVRVDLELGDVDQDIEEMADLCDELFNSDISIQSLTHPIAAFARAIHLHFKSHFEWEFRSEKVTGCLRKACSRSIQGGGIGQGCRLRRRSICRVWEVRAPSVPRLMGLLLKVPIVLFSSHNSLALKDLLSIPPGSAKLPSFRDLIASLPEAMAAGPNSETFVKHVQAFRANYNNIIQLTDVANIEDGAKYCQYLRVSYPHSAHASVTLLASSCILCRAFECTQKIGYLNDAISVTRDVINTADGPLGLRVAFLLWLISLLSTRLKLLCHEEDLHELMQLFSTATDYRLADSHHLDHISGLWTTLARRFGHPSTSTAYGHAMSSMQASLTFAPTLDKQHFHFVAMDGDLQTIPLDYASYHIHAGHLEQAVETVERGRALLWSEIRGLLTLIDQIRLADSDLADKFSAINRGLETRTLTFSLKGVDATGNNGLRGIDPHRLRMMQKQKLLDDREKLITQIQALPGFGTFLKPPSFDTLRPAASQISWPSHHYQPLHVAIGHTHSSLHLSALPDSYFGRLLYPREQIAG